LFAGDNPACDFEGPNALGWVTAMLVRPNGVKRAPFTPTPNQRAGRSVSTLAELIPLI
jgi:FMN phosphatase YigB (HAD superfamily)